MLNDGERNRAFAQGLEAPVGSVVDLGCGCGLLSRLALRSASGRVLGVEVAPHLARVARRLVPEAEGRRSWAEDILFKGFDT